uniref:Peptidase inhibitor 15 n=1 Tax=Pavo cristatus TaxID=9049 RepID=A0A8C9LDG0_PAVCR
MVVKLILHLETIHFFVFVESLFLTLGALFCQVWDETLAKSAEAWAATCIWDHGPSYLLRFLGQNLSVRTGRYRSILQLVKPWYDEVKDYAFPYPQDCNPRCPMRCYGPMCTHYTQMVWATSNRIGCAIHTCQNMNVWGSVWRRAVYLVCNYMTNQNPVQRQCPSFGLDTVNFLHSSWYGKVFWIYDEDSHDSTLMI